MNNQQQPGFLPMIMPFPIGQSQPEREIPPARVRVALEFLMQLTVKTMTRAAISDIAIEEIPGQKLTSGEQDAQQSACQMLADYFRGHMEPDMREKEERELLKRGLSGRDPGLFLRCMACAPGPINPNCRLCRGLGSVLVFPTSEGGFSDGIG